MKMVLAKVRVPFIDSQRMAEWTYCVVVLHCSGRALCWVSAVVGSGVFRVTAVSDPPVGLSRDRTDGRHRTSDGPPPTPPPPMPYRANVGPGSRPYGLYENIVRFTKHEPDQLCVCSVSCVCCLYDTGRFR